ncbi:MAG: hypothetical protein EPN33_04645 [Acidobacteria bacterium]|nr:MAG: hypothetical protein EPN33_04645 [Acidobacteriota bacterium]
MMTDTSPWAEKAMADLWRQRSGSERVRAACAMFSTARQLVIAGLRQENPGLAGAALRFAILERTYAADFAPDDWARLREQWQKRDSRGG